MTLDRGRRLATAALLSAVLAGCGSTVPVAQRGALAGSPSGAPATSAAVTGGAQPGYAGAAPAAGTQPGAQPAAAGATLPGGGSTAGPAAVGGARAAAGPLGPGVTATTVSVGVLYEPQSQLNASSSSFGAAGLAYGDLLVEQRAVADWINAHGGVAGGRKLLLVGHNASPGASSAQAVCADWTEDHKVFAAVYPGGQVESDVLSACMARHHAIYVNTPFDPGDQRFFDTYAPYYYAPDSLEAVRMGQAYVDGLVAQGFFSGMHKLGLLYYERPSLEAALAKGVKPALTRHGIALAGSETVGISYAADDSGDANTVSQIQSAELHMAANGVDRMMFLDTGAGLAYFFMTSAQSQSYRPRYGFESGSNPSFLGQNFGASQLAGSIGIGWLPAGDVDTAQIPDAPARALCRRIMTAAGQAPQSEADLLFQYETCASFFFLRDGLARATAPNAAAFARAVASLGSLPDASAGGILDTWRAGKDWGTGSYRFLQYAGSCSCFRYDGPDQPIS